MNCKIHMDIEERIVEMILLLGWNDETGRRSVSL